MSFPPKSIATNTKEIVDACELMELSLPPPPDSMDAETKLRYTKVTQMAGLLYLNEYQHARHLWRRCCSSSSSSSSSHPTTDPEFYQLKLLWSAGKHMISSSSTTTMTTTSTKPAFVGLNLCIQSNLHPLSEHAMELKEKYKMDLIQLLEHCFSKLSWVDCCEKLGVVVGKDDEEVMGLRELLLEKRGWVFSGENEKYISPPKGGYVTDEEEEDEMEMAEDMVKQKKRENKIQALTEIVAFMECQRTNA